MYLCVYQTLSLLWYPLTICQNCLGCPFLCTEAPLTDHCLLRRFSLANLRLLEGLGFFVVVVVMTLLGRYSLPMTVYLNKRSFCWNGQPSTIHRVYAHHMFVDDAYDPLSNACLLTRTGETLHLFICTEMKNGAFEKNPGTIWLVIFVLSRK